MSVKFFYDNVINADATFTLTSANSNLTSYLYDNNLDTQLRSSGSDDLTPEVWEIEFTEAKTIDRVFVGNHNIKAGKLEYWTGAAYTDFTNTAVSWSGNSATNSYFEVDEVSTLKVRLTIDTTITADDEKEVGQLRCMDEIGEVNTDPAEVTFAWKKRQKVHETSNGGNVQVVFGEKYQGRYLFSDANSTDVALFETLNNNNEAFYVYPGGGSTTVTDYGFRIQDMFLVNYINDFAPNLKSNIFGLRTKIELLLHEV